MIFTLSSPTFFSIYLRAMVFVNVCTSWALTIFPFCPIVMTDLRTRLRVSLVLDRIYVFFSITRSSAIDVLLTIMTILEIPCSFFYLFFFFFFFFFKSETISFFLSPKFLFFLKLLYPLGHGYESTY